MQAPVVICGVKVPFPEGKRPFPQQLAVMQKIIMACSRKEHALLESPTGTGKTLALLCGALAWQKKNAEETAEHVAKMQIEYEETLHNRFTEGAKMAAAFTEQVISAAGNATMRSAKKLSKGAAAGVTLTESTPLKGGSKHFPVKYDEDDDDPFVPDNTPGRTTLIKPPSNLNMNFEDPQAAMATAAKAMELLTSFESPVIPKKPYVRIFYSSRTHSQLAQVVAELKRCPQEVLGGPDRKGLRMCVLGSRDVYCINPTITSNRHANRTEECKELLKLKIGCACQPDAKKLAASTSTMILDVEDLNKLGKQKNQCPFFASKVKAESAHIVFLPYNYLIDPSVRKAMGLELQGTIVIFDEAHNVEDVARDAATIERPLDSLSIMSNILNSIGKKNPDLVSSTEHLADLFDSLCSWASERPAASSENATSTSSQNRTVLEGPEAIASWETNYGLTINSETLAEYRAHFNILQNPPELEIGHHGDDDDASMPSSQGPGQKREVLNSSAVSYIESIINVLEFMTMDNFQFARDFRIAVVNKWTSSTQAAQNEASMLKFMPDLDGEMPREKKPRKSGNELTFCIWCMNPAVAFRPIRDAARSVILTSGTLSPLKAFAAELGCEFKHTLEANHVCDIRSQLFASAFQRIGNELLDATFRNAERLDYLSGIGEAVLTIAKETPGGVLVFFPSYAMLERCQNRWRSCGLWESLDECKPISIESRGTTQEFERSVMEYRQRCREASGALFFAVFRGKLSEGIDFKDEAARAVVIVGIPYPNVKDVVVGLKKLHQDQARSRAPKNSPVMPLSGHEWYQQQAYRALNQALGRVIRHRHDYGAIILLDHRFGQLQVVENLSKWMRGAVTTIADVSDSVEPLRQFFERLRKNPPGTTAATAPSPSSSSTSSQIKMPPFTPRHGLALPYSQTVPPPVSSFGGPPLSTIKRSSTPFLSLALPSPAASPCIDLTKDEEDIDPNLFIIRTGVHKTPRMHFSPATADDDDDDDVESIEDPELF